MRKKDGLIDALGGVDEVIKRTGKVFSPQRVRNWRRRGIPAKVKLAHPELFLTPEERQALLKAVTTPQETP